MAAPNDVTAQAPVPTVAPGPGPEDGSPALPTGIGLRKVLFLGSSAAAARAFGAALHAGTAHGSDAGVPLTTYTVDALFEGLERHADEQREQLLADIRTGLFQAVMMVPPSRTFSRA